MLSIQAKAERWQLEQEGDHKVFFKTSSYIIQGRQGTMQFACRFMWGML